MSHPEGFGEEYTDPALFQALEGEFAGADERAKAIIHDELIQTAGDMKSALMELIPGLANMRFEPIRYPSYTNGGILAEDGQPLLYQPEDAYAIAKERPDFAEIIARKSHTEQLGERQQLAIDFELGEGDEEVLRALAEKKAELDYEADRIEFWSAVALLHPFNTQEMGDLLEEKYLNNIIWRAVDFDSRVRMLVDIEKERSHLEDENRGYSPAYFDAYEQAHGHDPMQKRWVNERREHTEQNAVKIQRYTDFLMDVLNGRLTTSTSDVEKPIPDHEVVLTGEQLRIKNLPGLDPVMMTLDERLKDIPQKGWLINADRIHPGVKGSVNIWRYTEGGFKVIGGAHRDLRYGQNYAYCNFLLNKSADTKVAYENADNNRTRTDYYYNILPDNNGNQFRYNLTPPRAYPNGGSYGANIYSYDLEQRERAGSPWYGMAAVRVTASPEEAEKIVSELLDVIGAGSKIATQVMATLEDHDVFGELKMQNSEEKNKFDALLKARRPKSNYDDEYSDPDFWGEQGSTSVDVILCTFDK